MDKPYLITLTGAKKNIGDFLITERCEKLLEQIKPDFELIKFPHWESLDDKLELVNNSCGIIIFGGPGYQINMYPGVYKLTKDLNDIKVPIIPLGLGWKGVPGDFHTLQNYKFNKTSLLLLNKIAENSKSLSCRDYYTARALENNGFITSVMTGCPVWYNLNYLGHDMRIPNEIKKIVYTPAQLEMFSNQSVDIMISLKKMFPDAEIYCSFHRGIGGNDQYTPKWDSINTKHLSERAKELGLIPVDTSYDLEKIKFYDDCDLHIGYRVHAHIYFLSMRKPSLLINEDGRGRGVAEALNINGVDGFKRLRTENILDRIPKVRVLYNRIFPVIGLNNTCSEEVEFAISSDLKNRFIRYSGLSKVIDENFNIMESLIKSLVGNND